MNGRFAVAFVRALQGDDAQYKRAVATCKHSLLYDVEDNRGTNSLHAPQRDLTDYFLVCSRTSCVVFAYALFGSTTFLGLYIG